MKRNPELIRAILLRIEASDSKLVSRDIAVNGYTEAQIAYHCQLLVEGNFIIAHDISSMQSAHKEYLISRLTNKGHDFCDASRNENVWQKVLTKITAASGSATLEILSAYLKQELTGFLGIKAP